MIDLPAEPKRILIVKPSAIGDIVHTLPVLKLLRNRWPAAHIEWLVMPAFAALLERQPLLNGIIRFDRKRFASSWRSPSRAKELKAFADDLRQRQFDLAIDFQGLFRSGWMTRQTGAPTRVGFAYAREFAPLAYTHRVPQPTPERHATERYLDIAEALGCGRGPVEFDFGLTDDDRQAATDLVGGAAKYAVLIPGTNWPTKRWPAESYAALAPRIEDELGLTVFFAGSPAEAALIPPNARSLAGRTNLPQLVALLEKASLVIANDSGPMHIAAALNRPLVTMYGPTNPVRTGPYARPDTVLQLDLVCRPCYSRHCVHQSCLRWITVDHVLAQARHGLSQVAPAFPAPAAT